MLMVAATDTDENSNMGLQPMRMLAPSILLNTSFILRILTRHRQDSMTSVLTAASSRTSFLAAPRICQNMSRAVLSGHGTFHVVHGFPVGD